MATLPAGIKRIGAGPPNPMKQKTVQKPRIQPQPPQMDPGPRMGGPTPAGPPASGPIYSNPHTPGPQGPPHMLAPQEPPFTIGPPGGGMYGVGGGAGGGMSEGGDGGGPLSDIGDALMSTVPEHLRNARPMDAYAPGPVGPPSGLGPPQIRPMSPGNGGGVINLPPQPGPYEGNAATDTRSLGNDMIGTTRDPRTGGANVRPLPPEIQGLPPKFQEMYRNQMARGRNNPAGLVARFRSKRNQRPGGGASTSFGVPNPIPGG